MKDESSGSMLPLPLQFLAAWLAVWFGRFLQQQIDYLVAENQILKEKLGDRKLKLTDADRRRLAVLGKELGRKLLAKVATIAAPDTILRWYREQVANKYDGSKRRGPGRPRKAEEIVKLVLMMVRENETRGYTRVKGALKNLGHTIGRSTIKCILREHGIDPAPIRGKRMPWSKFIKAHLGAIVGMDFFTVEVMTLFGLVRYHVLFAIDIGSRAVEIVGIGRAPGGRWMEQMARNLLDVEDGFLRRKRFLIMDRNPLYTAALRRMMKAAGVKVVRLPARSPNLNAYADRFVLSIKTECLARLVPLGEWHLRRAISEYVRHCHGERNHQGLDNTLIDAHPRTRMALALLLVARDSVDCSISTIERRLERVRSDFGTGRGAVGAGGASWLAYELASSDETLPPDIRVQTLGLASESTLAELDKMLPAE
jgi:putative transposase